MSKKEQNTEDEANEEAKPQRSEAKEQAEFQSTADALSAVLSAEPKVRIYVPLQNGEPKGTQLPVEINGRRFFVPKGVPGVEVPQSIADIVHQSLGIYDEASAALRSPNDASRPMRLDLQSEADRSKVS
jgi:hypothetical protein